MNYQVNLCCSQEKELKIKVGDKEKSFIISSDVLVGSNPFEIIGSIFEEVEKWVDSLGNIVGLPLESQLICEEHGVFDEYCIPDVPGYTDQTAELLTEEAWRKATITAPIVGVLDLGD